jgi:hypothetical protein
LEAVGRRLAGRKMKKVEVGERLRAEGGSGKVRVKAASLQSKRLRL